MADRKYISKKSGALKETDFATRRIIIAIISAEKSIAKIMYYCGREIDFATLIFIPIDINRY
jgi:hypothetical protein